MPYPGTGGGRLGRAWLEKEDTGQRPLTMQTNGEWPLQGLWGEGRLRQVGAAQLYQLPGQRLPL